MLRAINDHTAILSRIVKGSFIGSSVAVIGKHFERYNAGTIWNRLIGFVVGMLACRLGSQVARMPIQDADILRAHARKYACVVA